VGKLEDLRAELDRLGVSYGLPARRTMPALMLPKGVVRDVYSVAWLRKTRRSGDFSKLRGKDSTLTT
jgi:hypothetical protein